MARTQANGDVIRMIESEYGEFPGLALTRDQARRLFGLEPLRCDEILGALVASKRLRVTDRGTYVLNGDLP